MNRIKPIALGILCACLALPVAAADTGTGGGAAASPARAPSAVPSAQDVRASKLLGTKVHDSKGTAAGDISDLIVDTNTGRVHYAVLSLGGFLGMGDKLFAVPLSELRMDARHALTMDVDRDRLRSAPAFDPGHWPNWNDMRAEAERQRAAAPGDANARFRRASDILKTKVKDTHGGDVGNVKDLIVDLGTSRVRYVVVDFNRAWNPDDKLVALPMSAFADGASTSSWQAPNAEGAGAPRNAPPALALLNPGEPTKGTASAVNPPGSLETRPPAVDPKPGAAAQSLPPEPLKTTTSYADDESLVFKGNREELRDAPAFDPARYPG